MNHDAAFAPAYVRRRVGYAACRLVLAAAFLAAGITKVSETPQPFADSVAAFRLLPVVAVSPLALALPPFEVLVGLALLVNWPRRLGAYCALALSAVFFTALLSAAVRGLPVDCGCFGVRPPWIPLTPGHRLGFDLLRDLAIGVMSMALYRDQLSTARREPAA